MTSAPTTPPPTPARAARRRGPRVIGLAVTGLLALTGCSGDGDDAAGEGTTEPATTTAPMGDDTATTPPPAGEPATTEAATTEPPVTEPEVVGGPVTFEVLADIDATVTTGRFVVVDGADTLGCDEGRFYGAVDRALFTMTCETGSRSGEINMAFDPILGEDETFSGTWVIESGTGDFETLSGEGELQEVRNVEAGTITGTRSGEIRFDGGAG